MTISRRRFLQGAAAAGCLAGAAPLVHPRMAFASAGGSTPGDTLVLVTLRGGLDGLSALVPYGEGNYFASRPTTHVPQLAISRLDDRFGLSPAMAPLLKPWNQGDLTFVPAVGSPATSRSHFAQQDVLDRGAVSSSEATSGWLARHLATRPGARGALPAAAIAAGMPSELLGALDALATPKIGEAKLNGFSGPALAARLDALVRLSGAGPFAESAADAASTVRTLESAAPAAIQPANGAVYEPTRFSFQLRQVAQLIRAGVGLEVAALDWYGWDLHSGMGTATVGRQHDLLLDLATALSAFYVDVYDLRTQVTTIVISEFGRRLQENASGGTDHGHGGLAILMGGGVRGGIHGQWSGLAPDQLDAGDVAVGTDFRNVLGDVVQSRLANPNVAEVFPGHALTPVGAVNPR